MEWFRLVNALLEVIAALLTVPLMRAIQHRGARELRSFMIYVPILIWVVSAGLAISTGTLIVESSRLTIRTWSTFGIIASCVIIEIILIRKYRNQPRHLAKHQSEIEGEAAMPRDPFSTEQTRGKVREYQEEAILENERRDSSSQNS